MKKNTLIRLAKNIHRVILIGPFTVLGWLFLFIGSACIDIEDWLVEKLPVFGDDE